jgi:hypothetical protein|tara:strand:- start:1065 stop:1241 length:177 start_codon:yes stop_codon:yes gene_type:complete
MAKKHFSKLSILSFRQIKQLVIGLEVLVKAGPDWMINRFILRAIIELKIELEKRIKNL